MKDGNMNCHDLIEEEIKKLQASSTPPWNSATSERALRDALLRMAGESLKAVQMPFHALFTTGEQMETPQVKLMSAENKGWNDAVNDFQAKEEAWMKK